MLIDSSIKSIVLKKNNISEVKCMEKTLWVDYIPMTIKAGTNRNKKGTGFIIDGSLTIKCDGFQDVIPAGTTVWDYRKLKKSINGKILTKFTIDFECEFTDVNNSNGRRYNDYVTNFTVSYNSKKSYETLYSKDIPRNSGTKQRISETIDISNIPDIQSLLIRITDKKI